VSIETGTHELGPENATLRVKTYREGLAAKAGHDLVIEVTRWHATVDIAADFARSSVELSADPDSLQVREGLRGVKPLTDKNRAEIRKNIDQKVLGREPIGFHSAEMELGDEGRRIIVRGDLQMAGSTRPLAFELSIAPDGGVSGTVPVVQSDWGIKPYRGLMGALKVRDSLEVVLDARLPSA
jgi:polyisoprenoid-binding protein YceI